MKTTKTYLFQCCVGLLLSAVWIGCDIHAPVDAETTSHRVEIDLSSLNQGVLDGVQTHCLSVVDRVVLTVDMASGARQTYSDTLSAGTLQVALEVKDVEKGNTTFTAQVLSNNQSVLYFGETSALIEDDEFDVVISLEKQAPVMQVCPSILVLTQNNDFSMRVSLMNRGQGRLLWQASLLPMCGQCNLNPRSGPLAAGGTETVFVTHALQVARTDSLRFTSAFGTVTLPVQVIP